MQLRNISQTKTVGIIGGFGPEATSEFYLRLVAKHRESHQGNQPNVLIRNVAVSRELEQELLIFGKSDRFLPLLTSAARELEKVGADFIVLPCNTLHIHEAAIRKSIHIPFVSIIEATGRFLRHQKISEVGFLGSQITVKENLFQKKAPSVSFVSVNTRLQKKIDAGLDLFVAKQAGNLLSRALGEAFSFLQKKHIRHILLACTDFHALCPRLPHMLTHDTLDILVRATIDML